MPGFRVLHPRSLNYTVNRFVKCEVLCDKLLEFWRAPQYGQTVVLAFRHQPAKFRLRLCHCLRLRQWHTAHVFPARQWIDNGKPRIKSRTATPKSANWPLAAIENLLVHWQMMRLFGYITSRSAGLKSGATCLSIALHLVMVAQSPSLGVDHQRKLLLEKVARVVEWQTRQT